MQLSEIFAKDVQRTIEGVIKADDVSHLDTEVDEYVITNEAASAIETLLEEYTDYTNANGVWISGFFGSGKSHLLKMLAHLLGEVHGQPYDRSRVADAFRSKAEGAFLPGLLNKADTIPAKSLLFNIDQKASVISKDQTDALLSVFVKVFNDSCGYYGNQGYISRFERALDKRGQYDDFRKAYARIAGQEWAVGREEGVLEETNVARAFAEINDEAGDTPANILTKYRKDYQLSIEDFADDVAAWLEQQPDDFRLNFFVDEVGQFIGSNTKLMLNLQTIAETLNTKCRGRAWVFVTSQEDIDKVVGDRTKEQGHDFSKIRDRFKTRVKLTSADVEEVIRKRLLEKNDAGAAALHSIYTRESGNFKTLFQFTDNSRTYRSYIDEQHFVGTYPFASYQFDLLQAAFEGMSDHNVFEGRHSSVGERSMLDVFQQVVKDIGDAQVGQLATFDRMFAGIRATLKSAAVRSILLAEKNVDDELAQRLLKALFLVKYMDGFKATARNLTVLMYDHFGADLPALTKNVEHALAELERNTYIERNGVEYSYLTNEEQEIEQEIKSTDLDGSEVSGRLFKFLSEDVMRSNKVRYDKNEQDFTFGYILDDQPRGRQHELSVHFISPEYPYEFHAVQMHSAGKDELRVVLDADAGLITDLRTLLKTEKYIKRKHTASTTASVTRILQSKAAVNSDRVKEVVQRLRTAVGIATLVFDGAIREVKSADPVARLTEGLQQLIARTYTQLGLLGGRMYSDQQITAVVDPEGGLFDQAIAHSITPAVNEAYSFILQREHLGGQATVKSIVDNFESKPYGWDLASIEVVIASLVGTAQVRLSLDGNVLTRTELGGALTNTQKHPKIVVTRQKEVDQRKVDRLRSFCQEFFHEPNVPKTPDELGHFAATRLAERLSVLKQRRDLVDQYPFLNQLDDAIKLLEQSTGHSDEWYITDFDLGDELLDAEEGLLGPVQGFFNGNQLTIYDAAASFLRTNDANLIHLPPGSDHAVKDLLADPNVFRGNGIVRLGQARDELAAAIDQERAAAIAAALAELDVRKNMIRESSDYLNATAEAQQAVIAQIDSLIAQVSGDSSIGVIRGRGSSFDETGYVDLLQQLVDSRTQPPTPGGTGGVVDPPPPPPKRIISLKSVAVSGGPQILETEQDVDAYLDAFRSALMQQLADGKRVTR